MMKAWLEQHHYKRKIIFASHFLTAGLFIWLFIIFIYIYINNKQTMIFINRYSEADFELILFSLLLPFIICGLILNYLYLRKFL